MYSTNTWINCLLSR